MELAFRSALKVPYLASSAGAPGDAVGRRRDAAAGTPPRNAAAQVGRWVLALEAEAGPLLGVPCVRQLRLQRCPQLAQPGVDRLGSLDEGALLLEGGAERAVPAEEVERELHVGLRHCSTLWADAFEHLGSAGLG